MARLDHVWWLQVTANVESRILSPQTTYAAYFVFKLERDDEHGWRSGFNTKPVQLCVHFERRREDGDEINVFLDPSRDIPPFPQDRGDGWKEIEMGKFFNENGEDGLVVCSLKEVSCRSTWSGLIVEGIELRPRIV